jgi:hypothetical protein
LAKANKKENEFVVLQLKQEAIQKQEAIDAGNP